MLLDKPLVVAITSWNILDEHEFEEPFSGQTDSRFLRIVQTPLTSFMCPKVTGAPGQMAHGVRDIGCTVR